MSRLATYGAILSVLLTGCIFSPTKAKDKPPPPPIDYPALNLPQNTLYALVLSYGARDSSEYKLLFDRALYIGVSTDQSQPTSVTTDSLRWGDEARHISALRRAIDVTGVQIDFGPTSTWLRLPSSDVDDPPGSAEILIRDPRLTVFTHGDGGYTVSGVDLYEFRFGPTVSAPGDTTWKIIHWTEVRQRT